MSARLISKSPRGDGGGPARMRRACALAAAAALLCAAPLRAEPVPASGQHLEDLKSRVLDHLVDEAQRRQQQDCPAGRVAEIFFGGAVPTAAAQELTLTIDDTAPLHRSFEPRQLQALADGGLALAGCLDLAAGTHRVTLDFSPGAQQPAAQLAGSFEASGGAAPLIVLLQQPLPWSAPQLRLDQPQPIRPSTGLWGTLQSAFGHEPDERGDGRSSYVPGGTVDPRVRYARFLGRSEGSLSRLVELQRLGRADPAPASTHYPTELAAAALAFGLSAPAERTLREAIARDDTGHDVVALGLDLAAYCYARGEQARAAQILTLLRPAVRRDTQDRWQDLQVRVLLAQGDYVAAAGALRAVPNMADYASWLRYYNLGVALIDSGNVAQGLTVLNRVGNIATRDNIVLALREHANLMLANHFLQSGQGATAIPLFGRIGSGGAYADEALLGLGWAWLTPPGPPQAEAPLGDEIVTGLPPESAAVPTRNSGDQTQYQRFHVGLFDRASVPDQQDARLRRALAAWTPLLQRDPADPLVAEATLATAYALRGLGAHEEAIGYDERAVTTAEAISRRLDQAEALLRGADWLNALLQGETAAQPDADWRLPQLPPSPLTLYLHGVLAGDPFQSHLRSYRELLFLQGAASRLGTADEALQSELAQAQAEEGDALRGLLLNSLQEQSRLVQQITLYGRGLLSQEYDRPKAP